MAQTNHIQQLFVNKYSSMGEGRFYKFLITFGLNKIIEKGTNPANELMDYYDMFIKLYRRENKQIYMELARQFRKAGHRIYRVMIQKNMMEQSKRFLNRIA